MGRYSSGRPQIRRRVEDVQRVDALEYARENGGEIVLRPMPDGEFEMGTCPQCSRACRDLFAVESGFVCRDCAGLIYTAQSQSNSAVADVRSDPHAAGAALATMQNYVETGEPSHYNAGMKTLCALERLPDAATATGALSSELGDRILVADLNDSSALLEIIKAQILVGMENTTNRRGESIEIALRSDSLAKLARAFVTVAAFRADRAGQMQELLAARATPEERQSAADQLRDVIRAEGYKFPSGHTIDELRAAQRGEQQPDTAKFLTPPETPEK